MDVGVQAWRPFGDIAGSGLVDAVPRKRRVYLCSPQLPPYSHPEASSAECRAYVDALYVTPAEIDEIEQAPQRSEKWLKGKEKRIGASSSGSAVGNNQYSDQTKLLAQMLWKESRPVTSAIMQRGIDKEEFTTDMMEVYYTSQSRHTPGRATVLPPGEGDCAFWQDYPDDIWMESRNFIICHEYPWFGASTDGLFFDLYNESKAPGNSRFYTVSPPQYVCQMHQGMYTLKMKQAVLSVYTERGIELRYHSFDEEFWKQDLFPALEDFYMNQFVPRAVLQQKGLLKTNCLTPNEEIDMLDV